MKGLASVVVIVGVQINISRPIDFSAFESGYRMCHKLKCITMVLDRLTLYLSHILTSPASYMLKILLGSFVA